MPRWVKLKEEWEGHKAGEKIEVKGKTGKQLIAEAKAEETKSPAKRYIQKAVAKLQKEVGNVISESTATAVKEAVKAIEEEQSKQRKKTGSQSTSMDWMTGLGAKSLSDPSQDAEGKSFGDWLIAVREASLSPHGEGVAAKRLSEVYQSKMVQPDGSKAPLAEASGTTGGYTVPVEYAMRLMQLVIQQSIVRPRATIMPMAARSLHVPTLDVSTNYGAGQSAYLGGIVMNWTEEAQTRVETEPQFKQIELVAHELGGYTLASNTLLADNAVALDAFLTQAFSKAINWHQDYNFLQGNGAGKPLGILNAPASVVVNRSGGGTNFALVDVATMMSKLLTTSMSSSVWIMSQTVLPKLIQLSDSASRNIWLPNTQSPAGGAAQKIPDTLLGLPVLISEKVPALGTKGDVMLADFSYYLIGDRMQLEVASSIHFKFTNNQTTWRVVSRVDGQPWIDGPINLADGSTQVSPFVVLQ